MSDNKLPATATPSESLLPRRPTGGMDAWLSRWGIQANYLTEIERGKLLDTWEVNLKKSAAILRARVDFEKARAEWDSVDDIVANHIAGIYTQMELEQMGREHQLRFTQETYRHDLEKRDAEHAVAIAELRAREANAAAEAARSEANEQYQRQTAAPRIEKSVHKLHRFKADEEAQRRDYEDRLNNRDGIDDEPPGTDTLRQEIERLEKKIEEAFGENAHAEFIKALTGELVELKARMKAEEDNY